MTEVNESRRKSLFPSFKFGSKPGNRDFLQNSTVPGTIYHGRTSKEIPTKKIKEISSQYVSAFCAPPNCVETVHKCIKCKQLGGNTDDVSQVPVVRGIHSWESREDYAYGMATSLYEKLPTGKCSGDPIADSLAIVTRDNCAIMALADGVSWGQKSRLASNCSIYGSITYLCQHIHECTNTKHIFRCLIKAFESAQSCIVEEDATLTTLCVAVVVELHEKGKWCLCVVNVGDSYAYIYNKQYGVKEVTHGSHPIDEARDMRYSGGALGPADGYNPDLANLTCSLVVLDEGDIVFLCSDGISDNFDPAVAKFVPRFKIAELTGNISPHHLVSPQENLIKDNKCGHQSLGDTPNCRHQSLSDIPKCRRHQSLGDIPKCLPNVLNHQRISDLAAVAEDDEESLPSEEIYFKYDETDSCEMTESKIIHKPDVKPFVPTSTIINDLRKNGKVGNKKFNHVIVNHGNTMCGDVHDIRCRTNSATLSLNIEENCICAKLPEKDLDINDICPGGVPLTPRERHEGALEQMREVITTVEFEPINNGSKIRAVDICAQIMNFVINRTAEKREILEQHPQSQMKELTSDERRVLSQKIKQQLKDVPGKLDHASLVAYEVGHHFNRPPLSLDVEKSTKSTDIELLI